MIPEIVDDRSLIDWVLKQSPKVEAQLACRVALRIMPLAWANGGDRWPTDARRRLLIVRTLLTAELACRTRDPQVLAVCGRIWLLLSNVDSETATVRAFALEAAAIAARISVEPSPNTRFFEVASRAADATGWWSPRIAKEASGPRLWPSDSAIHPILFECALGDCVAAAKGEAFLSTPLWGVHRPLDPAWDLVRAEWQAFGADWSFWIDWYEALLAGREMDAALLKEIALLPDTVWDAGAATVAGAIQDLRLRFALAKTENGETLVPNPETGRLRLVATSTLPEKTERRARRAMVQATRLFSGPIANQQYRALTPDLDILNSAANDPEATPVELFDACASVSRRLRVRIANGECPDSAQDALIEDYRLRLTDIAADILSSDPETQDVLNRRNAIKGNNALIHGRDALAAFVDLALPVVEGRLEVAIKVDLEIATIPNADPEERQHAGPRFAGRLLRIYKYVALAVRTIGGAVIRAEGVLAALRKIAADPIVQRAYEWIMLSLGL